MRRNVSCDIRYAAGLIRYAEAMQRYATSTKRYAGALPRYATGTQLGRALAHPDVSSLTDRLISSACPSFIATAARR